MDLSNLITLVTQAAVETAEHTEDTGIIGTLGLNWKLFIAQLVNFAVVLFILWKWVFNPVVGALEKRRQKIEESVKKAEAIDRAMREFEEKREKELVQSRGQAQQIIEEATRAAEASRAELVTAAHAESEKMIEKARQAVKAEKELAMSEARTELAEVVAMATEKIIKVKLDEKKDREIINDIVKDIK